jgi:N-methylhydantoinase A
MMTEARTGIRIAGDVGGTFTDLVMVRERTGESYMAKIRSTPPDLADGFVAGVQRLLALSGASPDEVSNILFTSTAATNAVLQHAGARIGLIVTKGFRHILEIARANIPGRLTNELTYNRPERLVPLDRVREVDERCVADGSVLRPLDEEGARRAIRDLLAQQVECIAVSLLHSYVNPAHEQRIRALIAEERPDMLVSLSSDVVPVYREYERTMTTVLNAYVMPVMERAVRGVQTRLRTAGLDPVLSVGRCDGGLMSAAAAVQTPVNTVLSGPAAGVYGAAFVARQAGYRNVISLDMGGTSTDVSLAADGKARIRGETMVSEYPVKIPVMDIVTIGAGGGSIAFVSPTGALHVGPRSAGSDPGPICYGLGGTEVTVTDANLVLGRLPPTLAGGEIAVDVGRARAAMEALARKVGLGALELAQGIVTIVNEKMLGALRVVSVQRGYDPKDFVLIPFGGAGPMHAGELYRRLGMARAVIPPAPGVLSAVGALVSDVTYVVGQTWLRPVDRLPVGEANQILEHLAARAEDQLAREGFPRDKRELIGSADLRYAGQASEISVPSPGTLTPESLVDLVARFHAEHRRLYGFDWAGEVPVELVAFKVTGVGHVDKTELLSWDSRRGKTQDALIGGRQVYFDGRFVDTPCYERGLLGPGRRVAGPAIVEQLDCTTVILSGQAATVDDHLNLVVEEV